jgi:hypothetical protein
MRNSLVIKSNILFWVTLLAIAIFVFLVLFDENNLYWYGLAAILIVLQTRFRINTASLFPIIAVLALTEYYFLISGKRVYLCEIVYVPLVVNYILTDFAWKRLNRVKLTVLLLILAITVFQAFNFLINADLSSSFFRFRTLALPLFLIVMVNDEVQNQDDLKRIINIILLISLLATLIVYLQFFTGQFYILQNNSVITDDQNFTDFYLSYTEDSFLFNLMGLHIKGPMPPVGLNYFKFGYSEKIIVPAALFFSMFKFKKSNRRYIYLILFLFLALATLLTGSRSVLLVFLFIASILHLFYKKKLRWNFILVIIFSFFAITYLIGPLLDVFDLEEFGTLAGRIFYMDDFFRFIQAHPLVLFAGSTPNLFLNLTSSAQPPHHFFAFGVVCDGIIVTTVLFFLFYKLLKATRNFITDDKELLAIGCGLWVSLFGFVFIYGQTSYLTWSIPHNMFFCIIIGLLMATYRLSKKQKVDSKMASQTAQIS